MFAHLGLSFSTLRLFNGFRSNFLPLSPYERAQGWSLLYDDKKDLNVKVLNSMPMERRDWFLSIAYSTGNAIVLIDSMSSRADAAVGFTLPGRGRATNLYAITPEENATVSRGLIAAQPELLSSELCLLRLLPVGKKTFLRELQTKIEAISNLKQTSEVDADMAETLWYKTSNATVTSISVLDSQRVQLEPVFIQDDSTELQIGKSERFEVLVELLRSHLVTLVKTTMMQNLTETLRIQKKALITLSEIGELLVPAFPYKVPSEGKYSYLPRLLGRAKVTFTIKRQKTVLGNITIVADGFAAPITAGNFVDLSERNFYTGLPIKFSKKRVGSGSDFDVGNLPILGSFQEGFYDPLTAKLRKLPLELIRVEKGSSEQDLTYTKGLSSLDNTGEAVLEPAGNSKPLLSFKIPGLVAMFHPDRNLNGASTEFFSLQVDSMIEEKRGLLDGEYAPFGYIIEGLDLFQTLQANDVIDKTFVDKWGLQYLTKLRKSSFTEVVQAVDLDLSSEI